MKRASSGKRLTSDQCEELLDVLQVRFHKNMNRHKSLKWISVQEKFASDAAKLWALNEMNRTGGEPDVVGYDKKSGEYLFFDCSAQTPSGRTSLCYDGLALDSRKANKPKNSAIAMAAEMGIEVLTEAQYRQLQKLGEFDTKSSSWIKTPDDIRELGGALFCDRRFGHVFVYHNGAESYFAGRGFRAVLKV